MHETRPEPPFRVLMAGYVVDFHHRHACPRCQPDGTCRRLTAAAETLRAWRDRPHRPRPDHTTPDHAVPDHTAPECTAPGHIGSGHPLLDLDPGAGAGAGAGEQQTPAAP